LVPSPKAEAGFLSIFGTEASAEAAPLVGNNSQNMGILASGVSPVAMKDTAESKDAVDPNGHVDIYDNALMAPTSPMGSNENLGIGGADDFGQDISVYVVRKGDTVSQVAAMFDVSVNTILWANDMKKGQALQEGDVLFILPISGLEHTVAKGETLKGIAAKYKADPDEIALFNEITPGSPLAIGDKLIIPDAQKAEENAKPVKNLSQSIARDNQYYQAHPVKNNVSGYFIDPVPGYRKSQGLHDRNGVDLAIAPGTPIHAAAAGRVSLARNGYNGGFGNLVIISHPNGTETLYAHMSKIATTTGSNVASNQVIGYVGSTGHSTGPHLHFEVHGAKNPGADGSWKN
jgi:murein DD-endopeptidase MepM/ murein hydrolase activator NlpD